MRIHDINVKCLHDEFVFETRSHRVQGGRACLHF